MIDDLLRDSILRLLRNAGGKILEIYRKSDPVIRMKEDNSPVTEADLISDMVIQNGLAELTPGIPVFSEETKDISFEIRGKWNSFWVLDPLDGTKEFIARNDEFCICLALITDKRPVAGFIHVPVSGKSYYALSGKGAFMLKQNKTLKLPLYIPSGPVKISISRSHYTLQEEKMVEKISDSYRIIRKTMGSAIKFCRVAEGKVDLYPRFKRSNEWDVAAGDIIVKESGGTFFEIHSGREPFYNRHDAKIEPFLACGTRGKTISGSIPGGLLT